MTCQLPLRSCPNPTCHPTPCLRDCPKERAREGQRFRQQLRKRRVVGPVPYWIGRLMLLCERWDPWSMMERNSPPAPVESTHVQP